MKRIGIIGAGRFGSTLAECLIERGAEVVVLERDNDTVQTLSVMPGVKAVQGDAMNEKALKEAGFGDCQSVVIAISENMLASVIAALKLKEMKVPSIVAKAGSDNHGKILELIGADMVVYPEKDRARRLARSLLASSECDIFGVADGVSIAEMKAPEGLVGKTLGEARIPKAYGVNVLVIRRVLGPEGKSTNIISPTAEDKIEKGDILIVFGSDKKVDSLS